MKDEPAYASAINFLAAHFKSILIVALLCGAAGFGAFYLMRPAYRAQAIVMPVHNASHNIFGGLAQGLGGMLGLAGDVDKNEPIQVIGSRTLLKGFIEERNLVELFCRIKAIKCIKSGLGDAIDQEHFLNSTIDRFQKRILGVTENNTTSSVRVSITWYDRVVAAQWCNDLIELTNRTAQARAQAISEMRTKYLRQEMETTSVVSLQSALSTLLVSEMTKKMDAATQPQYAWHVIDPATPPDDRFPAGPGRWVFALAASLIGSLLWIGVLRVSAAYRDSKAHEYVLVRVAANASSKAGDPRVDQAGGANS
jgi:uncharacterized protein involved in exopolysaccharide biosynthesis